MARRANGEGSIVLRSDGRWQGVAHVGYANGRRVRKYVYARSQREVREKLQEARRAVERGLDVTEDLTVGAFLERWLAAVRPSLRERTYLRYLQLLALHVTPTLGRVRLTRLSPAQVQALINAKVDSGLSSQTVRHIHAVLRTALNQAVRWQLVPRNVASLVTPPRVERVEMRALSPDEARTFLDAVAGRRLEALYVVALGMGLRQGEVLGLSWEDVDFDAAELSVRKSLQRVGGEVRFVEPKSVRSRRTLAVPGFVVDSLRSHHERQLRDQVAAGQGWHDSGLVFTTSLGTPLDGANVRRDLRAILGAAGLPAIRFHDLRHSCASLMVANGEHMRVIMETLGHSQIGITMNLYSHIMPAAQREAAERMDALLGTPSA